MNNASDIQIFQNDLVMLAIWCLNNDMQLNVTTSSDLNKS